jgi:hypothetical protein
MKIFFTIIVALMPSLWTPEIQAAGRLIPDRGKRIAAGVGGGVLGYGAIAATSALVTKRLVAKRNEMLRVGGIGDEKNETSFLDALRGRLRFKKEGDKSYFVDYKNMGGWEGEKLKRKIEAYEKDAQTAEQKAEDDEDDEYYNDSYAGKNDIPRNKSITYDEFVKIEAQKAEEAARMEKQKAEEAARIEAQKAEGAEEAARRGAQKAEAEKGSEDDISAYAYAAPEGRSVTNGDLLGVKAQEVFGPKEIVTNGVLPKEGAGEVVRKEDGNQLLKKDQKAGVRSIEDRDLTGKKDSVFVQKLVEGGLPPDGRHNQIVSNQSVDPAINNDKSDVRRGSSVGSFEQSETAVGNGEEVAYSSNQQISDANTGKNVNNNQSVIETGPRASFNQPAQSRGDDQHPDEIGDDF